MYYGDINPGDTLDFYFSTFNADGTPGSLTGGVVGVCKDSAANSTSGGMTLTANFNSITGLNHVAIYTPGDPTLFSAGSNFTVILSAGSTDFSQIGRVVGSFSIQCRSAVRPATAGRTIALDASGRVDLVDAPNATAVAAIQNGLPAAVRDVSNSSPAAGSLGEAARNADAKAADIQSRIPAALTGDGNIKADALKFDGNSPVQTSGKLWVLDDSGNAVAPAATALSTAVWTGTIAGRIDAAISSRMATFSLPTNFASMAITAGGIVQADLQTIKTQSVTCAAGVTIPALLASTTNITGGTITTVTNLTNAPTAGDLTATMKTSVTAAATAATPTVTAGTVSDKTGYALTSGERNSIADAYLDRADAIETSITPRLALRYMGALLGGVITTAGTSSEVFKGLGVATTRVTVTADSSGDRSAVVLA